MATAPYNVESMLACKNGLRKVDGAYLCYLHHLVGAGVRRTEFKMGNSNPLDEDLNDLVVELQGRLPHVYKFMEGKKPPVAHFIGLSIVRECTRNGHGARKKPEFPDAPRTEGVASFAFAKEPLQITGIHPNPAISARGVGSATRTGVGRGATDLEQVIHLPVTSELMRTAPPLEVVAAFPNKNRARDPVVALHNLNRNPEAEPQYLEQIVPRSSIKGQ